MKTEMTFTPGPWRVVQNGEARFAILSDANSAAINRWVQDGGSKGFADNATTITELHTLINGSGAAYGPSKLIDDEEVEANARLIAAAPAMWEALQKLEALTTKSLAGGYNHQMAKYHTLAGEYSEQARAALKLAGGGE